MPLCPQEKEEGTLDFGTKALGEFLCVTTEMKNSKEVPMAKQKGTGKAPLC